MGDIVEINPGNGLPMDDLREDVCEHCAFSKFGESGSVGECRANPPTPVIVPMQKQTLQGMQVVPTVNAVFPPVERRSFCYTFEPKDAEGDETP